MNYLDIPGLSSIAHVLRTANEAFRDRQVRVKLEAYEKDTTDRNEAKGPMEVVAKEASEDVGSVKNVDEEREGKEDFHGHSNKRKTSEFSETSESNSPATEISPRNKKTAIVATSGSINIFSDKMDNEATEVDNSLLAKVVNNFSVSDERKENSSPVSPKSASLVDSVPTIWRGKHPKRTLLQDLIGTMNSAFTDYDFSSVSTHCFSKTTLSSVMSRVKSHFVELSTPQTAESITNIFMQDLWVQIGRIVSYGHIGVGTFSKSASPQKKFDMVDFENLFLGVEIYTYIAKSEYEIDADPLSTLGNLWAFNYFFCNSETGKIVMLACSCRQKRFSQLEDNDDDDLEWSFDLDNEIEVDGGFDSRQGALSC